MSKEYFAKKISLQKDEKIISIIHHHPIIYFKQIVITIVIILLAFFLMFYLVSLGAVGVALFVALFFTGIIYGLREFFVWYANVFVITNQRIIDIDQNGFFSKTVSEVGFEKILDICYAVKGFKQTILKLGTIKVQASGVKLVISNVKEVAKINQLLTNLIKEQTGKDIEVKKVRELTSVQKGKVTQDFLDQEVLDEYDEYDMDEVIDEYIDIFSELRLKKVLVDEIERYDEEYEGKFEPKEEVFEEVMDEEDDDIEEEDVFEKVEEVEVEKVVVKKKKKDSPKFTKKQL